MKLYFFFKIFDCTRLPPFIYDKIRLGANLIIKFDNPFCVKNLRNQNAYIYFDLVWFSCLFTFAQQPCWTTKIVLAAIEKFSNSC